MDDATRDKLAAIDRALGEVPIPAELEQRILQPREATTPRWPLLALGIVVPCLLLGLWWLRGPSSAERSPAEAPSMAKTQNVEPSDGPAEQPAPTEPAPVMAEHRWGGSLALAPGCRSDGDASLSVRTGCALTLAEPSLTVDVIDDAELRPARRGLAIDAGLVLVTVEHIDDRSDPVRVEVVGGSIEVTGTRFVVVQSPTGGYVHLIEGAIDFVPDDGPMVRVEPGVPLSWGDEAKTEGPVPIPAKPSRPRRRAAASVELERVLDEVAGLRRKGHYRQAVTTLQKARTWVNDHEIERVLSFEEGTLREHYVSSMAACSYWRGHVDRFHGGRPPAPIERRLATLGCGTTVENEPG